MPPPQLLPTLTGDVPVPGPKGNKLHLRALFPLQLGGVNPNRWRTSSITSSWSSHHTRFLLEAPPRVPRL